MTKRNSSRENHIRGRSQARAWVLEYRLNHPCVDCGESDPVCLDFDHVRGVKWANISTLVSKGATVATIKDEVRKCDVRCSNCHRKVTALRKTSDG